MARLLKYRYYLLIIILSGVLYSCYDKNLTNLDNSIIFTPEYSVPIGYGEFSMLDVVSSPSFDTIPADTANWHDSLYFEYEGKYYYLPPDGVFDTILYEDFDFSLIEDWLDNTTYLMFRMNMENGFPGGILLQVEFRDANNNIVFSLFDNPGIEIAAAINGNTIKRQEDTYLTLEEINSFRLVSQINSYIRLDILDLTENVSYHPDQVFKIQMGIRVGLEIDSNDQPI